MLFSNCDKNSTLKNNFKGKQKSLIELLSLIKIF